MYIVVKKSIIESCFFFVDVCWFIVPSHYRQYVVLICFFLLLLSLFSSSGRAFKEKEKQMSGTAISS